MKDATKGIHAVQEYDPRIGAVALSSRDLLDFVEVNEEDAREMIAEGIEQESMNSARATVYFADGSSRSALYIREGIYVGLFRVDSTDPFSGGRWFAHRDLVELLYDGDEYRLSPDEEDANL